MGLDKLDKNFTYVSVYKSNFTVRWKTEPADYDEKRENKLGATVYEKYYPQLSGHLVDIGLKAPPEDHKEYGHTWVFTVVDGEDTFKLQISAKNFTSSPIMNRLKNINYSQKVQFKIFPDREDPSNSVMTIMQGEKVLPWITKEEPQGLPQAEWVELDEGGVWKTGEQLKYYVEMVKTQILPQIFEQNPEAIVLGDGAPSSQSQSSESSGGLSTEQELNEAHITGQSSFGVRDQARDARGDEGSVDDVQDLPF